MKKSIFKIFVLFCLVFTSNAIAQEAQPSFWDNVRFGGGIGLSFGNGFFSGTLAPSAIYQFDSKFAAGVGLSGTYNSQRDVYNSTIIGGSVLGLYNVIPELQLSAEFEQNYVSRNFDERTGFIDDDYFYSALFLGGGYRTGPVTIGIRYDVLFDERDSIYANAWVPFVRVFF